MGAISEEVGAIEEETSTGKASERGETVRGLFGLLATLVGDFGSGIRHSTVSRHFLEDLTLLFKPARGLVGERLLPEFSTPFIRGESSVTAQ